MTDEWVVRVQYVPPGAVLSELVEEPIRYLSASQRVG